MFVRVQLVEIRHAIGTEPDRLTIDDEGWRSQVAGSLDDQRIAVAPVVAIAREHPHALALALNEQAITVVLDFVKPVGVMGDFGPAGRDAGLILTQHGL
jgi:hypothetical protein